MKNLSIKTLKPNNLQVNAKYTENLKTVTTFLRHSEDRILIISGETVNIEITDNGKPIFVGTKQELFEKLKQ